MDYLLYLEKIIDTVGLYVGTMLVGFVSGLVPLINLEVFLLILSPTISKSTLVPVSILSSVSQMLAKSLVFFVGRGMINLSVNKHRKKINAVRQKFLDWKKRTDFLIFLSAFIGIPPLYIVSFVAGTLRLSFASFFIIGLIGRFLRFGSILYFPPIVQNYI